MAVENKYIHADLASDKLAAASEINGAKEYVIQGTFEVAAADDNGSVYRLAAGIPADAIITEGKLWNDAITAATDYDFGLYDLHGGAVVDKDVFMDGEDISAGNAIGSEVDLLHNVTAIEGLTNRLWEHAAATEATKPIGYDLALTANTVGSAAGTIVYQIKYIIT